MAKKAYRVRNWRDYNEALVNRGSITFWFDEESIKNWHEKPKGKRGRPRRYSDLAINCGLTLKALFHLPFRAVEGFIKSLIREMNLEIEAPDYSLLCKRQRGLKFIKKLSKRDESIHILVDSTGIKVFGEGEWKVRQHGYVKHRLWRKLHVGLNSATQEIESYELSDLGVQDWEGFERLVAKTEKKIIKATGDGAYDRHNCYELAEKNNFELITPPQRNARTSKERKKKLKKGRAVYLKQRDETIKKVRKVGRAKWKVMVGYHRRSLAETTMFRLKTLLGNRFSTRLLVNQKVEAGIWCGIINKMNTLGMPRAAA